MNIELIIIGILVILLLKLWSKISLLKDRLSCSEQQVVRRTQQRDKLSNQIQAMRNIWKRTFTYGPHFDDIYSEREMFEETERLELQEWNKPKKLTHLR